MKDRGYDADHFDEIFGQGNRTEWGFFDSDYEQNKYVRTLERALDRRSNPKNVLEIGPGTGAFTQKALQEFGEINYTAVDISPEAIRRTRENLDEAGLVEHVRLVNKDAVEFVQEYDGDPFDLVFASEVLYYLSEDRGEPRFVEFAELLEGLTAQDGFLVSANIHRQSDDGEPKKNDYSSIRYIHRILEEAGWETREVSRFVEEKTWGDDKPPREHEYGIWVMAANSPPRAHNFQEGIS